MLVDTHCHLDFPDFNADRAEVIQRAKSQGIKYIINIGSSLKGSRDSVALAKEYDCIYSTVGIHPHEADDFDKAKVDEIRLLAANKKVVAIGEIGLDFFKNFSKAQNQRTMFEIFLLLAKELNLPVVIHSRQADQEMVKLLKNAMPIRAVVHCFSGDELFMKACLDMGFYVSFTCNITYKKAQNLRELVRTVPLDRLFLETDAPFLSPENLRGKRNEPANVKLLAEEIARIRKSSFQDLAASSTENAVKFFNLS